MKLTRKKIIWIVSVPTLVLGGVVCLQFMGDKPAPLTTTAMTPDANIVASNTTAAPGAGTVAGVAPTVGTVAGVAPTAGTVAGVAPTAGTVAGVAPTAGTVAGVAPTAGTVAGVAPTAGTVAGVAPTAGTVAGVAPTAGTVAGVAPTAGTVAGVAPTAGTVAGVAPTAGTVAGVAPTAGTVAGVAPTAGTVAGVAPIMGPEPAARSFAGSQNRAPANLGAATTHQPAQASAPNAASAELPQGDNTPSSEALPDAPAEKAKRAPKVAAQPVAPKCFLLSFHHKPMSSHSDDEDCFRHKNLLKVKAPAGKKVDMAHLCVRVDQKAVAYQSVKGHSDQILLDSIAGPKSKITIRYCVDHARCSDDCKVPTKPKDEFLDAIGGSDGGGSAGQWDDKSGKSGDVTAKIDGDVKRELAGLDENGQSTYIFKDWVLDDTTPVCQSASKKKTGDDDNE